MAKPRPSVLKRQREQARRERTSAKAEKKAQRKTDGAPDPNDGIDFSELVREEKIEQ